MQNRSNVSFVPGELAVGIVSLVGLYVISRYSYTLFHMLAELYSIVIGFSLFLLTWNSRRIIDNNYLIFIGIAYFFVAGIDLVHTLAYKGMDIFAGYGTNLPTQLWIAARSLTACSLLAAPFTIRRKLRTGPILAGYTAITILLLVSVFCGHFPDCHVEGSGLTQFKIFGEYVISAILLAALLMLLAKRQHFDRDVLSLLVLSIATTIGSELAFTFYIGVFDLSNLVGHYLKIIAFYLIYKAIIETGLAKPYALMFRNLKQTEAALRESEEQYRSLFEHMTEGFALHEIVCNDRGEPSDYRFLDINPAFERFTGLKRADVIGKLVTEVLPDIEPGWIATFGEVTMTGNPVHFENYAAPLKRHYEVFAYRPAPRQFAVIFMDVTVRKQAETELKRHAALLEETNREMESFSYSVSHDLRAPLRAIEGYARMIIKRQEAAFDAETRRQFDLIQENARMMGQLIDDILAFSRLGRQPVTGEAIDMETLVREVWGELRTINPDRQMNLTIGRLPAGCGDRALLKQVVANLLSNAVKFTGTRNPAAIEVGGEEREGETAYFVKDNGVGFDMRFSDRLFVVFQRLHAVEEFEGTGVGLAIVQRIVLRHGGRVWAESEPDRGATFWFSLPFPGRCPAC
ncbi:MAG: MASE3 domain-containing protein [Syntrophales bacterium]